MRREFWRKLWQGGGSTAGSDDPEALIEQAQEEMRLAHLKNRERATQAITQKNNIETLLSDIKRKIEILQAKANAAELREDVDGASQLRQDLKAYQESVEMVEQQLHQANETAEQVKRAIRADEELYERKTAEALSLRVQWKTVQIEQALARFEIERSAGGDLAREPGAEDAVRFVRHRRLLIEAIIGKNHLGQMARDMKRQLEMLGRKAEYADNQGNERLATHLLRVQEQYEATTVRVEAASDRAEQVVAHAKQLLDAEYQFLTERQVTIPDEADIVADEARAADEQEHNARSRKIKLLLALAVACLLLLLLLL